MPRLLLAGWLALQLAAQAAAAHPDCVEPIHCPYPRTCWTPGQPGIYSQTSWSPHACYAPTRWRQSPPQPPCPLPAPCCDSEPHGALAVPVPVPELLPAPRLMPEKE
jgi:hypothetical protein